ncbi:hypothetical protein [Consotaella aegiceratis]|uniref:hypothetical protein n=1 Tax=Consotaella aegiceratis TaxID=3097961 RepID=UPI002F3ED215
MRVFGFAIAAAATLAVPTGAAWAQADGMPDYRDDRSTATSVIESLYNAIERREYLRAWSYFRDEPDRPDFDSFSKGYETTEHVRVKTGEAVSEGAAGSIYTSLPAVAEATSADGGISVYAGCYQLRLVQPAVQATPPYQPMGIVNGHLAPVDASFEDASGDCEGAAP